VEGKETIEGVGVDTTGNDCRSLSDIGSIASSVLKCRISKANTEERRWEARPA
jgi:hypothetical protein